MQELARFIFGISGYDDAVDLRGDLSDFAPGSRNLMPDGVRQSRAFKGLQMIGSGGRRMFQIKNSWGSLDDIGADQAAGSFFSSIADMLVFIGRGQVKLQTNDIAGAVASALLKFLLKWNGSYTDPRSGPYTAGLPEPEAPEVGIVSGDLYGAPSLTGTVSIKYARLRTVTGGRSRASETSAVLPVTNNSIWAYVPPAVSGQDKHVFFGTDTKLGGIGLHYRIARANPFTQDEYTEADVERTIANLSTSSTDILVDPAASFTAGDIGKRVAPVSGFTVPAGTTIIEIISTSQVRLSNPFTVTSGTMTAKFIAYAGGIDRSVVLNWKPSDLIEETAWIYDFAPPAGSHAFQLENRMFVASYANANSVENLHEGTDSDNPGTALIPSIANNFESYDPRFPVYLPEEVVDILSDGMESYKFIGGRHGIYAAQFLNVDRAAPLTLTVLLRGEGIASPNNWCARERAIYLFTGKGQAVRIIEGGAVDLSFAAKVRARMRKWNQADVVVSPHPAGGGVVYSHLSESFFYDEATGRWSTLLSLNDFAAGNVISSIATSSELILTLASGSNRTAYYFDKGTGSFVCGIGHYQETPAPQRQKIVQRLSASGVADRTDKTGYLGLHANTLKTHVSDGAISSGTNSFSSAAGGFTQELVGAYILIKGAGTSGGFLFGRITSVPTANSLLIGTPADDLTASVPLNALMSVSSAYALIGLHIFPFKVNRTGTFELESGEMFIAGLTSYACSMLLETAGDAAQPLAMMLDGFVNEEEGWTLPSANFNQSV